MSRLGYRERHPTLACSSRGGHSTFKTVFLGSNRGDGLDPGSETACDRPHGAGPSRGRPLARSPGASWSPFVFAPPAFGGVVAIDPFGLEFRAASGAELELWVQRCPQ